MRRDGSVEVVDVKPAHLVDEPEVAGVLAWTGRVTAERGWRYSVWSGASMNRLTNVRFLAQGRRLHLVDRDAIHDLHGHGSVGSSLGEALEAASRTSRFGTHALRAAMICLLWQQAWEVALDEPLGSFTRIDQVGEVWDARVGA